MQVTETLTNSQKLELLKKGCSFQVKGSEETFQSADQGLYLAFYKVHPAGTRQYTGSLCDWLHDDSRIIIMSTVMTQLITISIKLSEITIL